MHALGVFTRRMHQDGTVSRPSLAQNSSNENDLRTSHAALFSLVGEGRQCGAKVSFP